MSLSKWDLQEPPNSSHSNIQCFIDSVTPIVPTQAIEKVTKEECFFSFKDLWEYYIEWSIYGVSVPIILQNGDCVVQYYSPSLSALQIFTTKPSSISCRNSETSLDRSVDRHGFLYCQFNETSSPYSRVPFTEKINELAQTYEDLLKFKSTDVSPYSWMAVAWYPIYQIPIVRNVKELSACFLTYHKLSTSSSLEGHLTKSRAEEGMSWSKGNNWGDEITIAPFAMATYKMYGTLWTNPESSDQKMIISHLNAASSWLNQLRFWHHDFDFFMSRRL
ncbi:hypothetical protein ACOSQ3_020136 [Xanthoceras sorbifolium]